MQSATLPKEKPRHSELKAALALALASIREADLLALIFARSSSFGL